MRAGLAAAALGVLSLLPACAVAHSLLLESSPTAGASIATPGRVALRFNNRVEQALSSLRVVDSLGTAHRLSVIVTEGAADRLTATLPRLAPGPYRVEWQVLSTDGHIVSGNFSFRVVP